MVSSPAGDLCQDRGDEVLRAQVRRNGPADFARHVFHGGQCDGASPEGAEHVPGEQDGAQAVAAHVADDDPDPVPGGDDLIQIPADRGLACRGAVAGAMVIPVISGGSGGSSASCAASATAVMRARRSSRRRRIPATTTAIALTAHTTVAQAQ
jgi:hypothetical protein